MGWDFLWLWPLFLAMAGIRQGEDEWKQDKGTGLICTVLRSGVLGVEES